MRASDRNPLSEDSSTEGQAAMTDGERSGGTGVAHLDMRAELRRIASTVVVDLDGTLMTPPRPILDASGDLRTDGEPEPGAVEAMQLMHAAGWRIVVSSSRTWDRWGPQRLVWADAIRAWLDAHEIPYDEVFVGSGKPAAAAYIDDNAIRYERNWPEITERLGTPGESPAGL